uniref:Uncharacterized protein LOC114340405 n=2 Tax=Diabrotica virgifera virgifera TaxID=50390 RepID=A0A6P7GC39_DIAVI
MQHRILRSPLKNRMAFHHVVSFCTIMVIWHILLTNAQESLEKKDSYMLPDRTRDLLRSRKISQRAFQNMDLLVARSFGKRASDCSGGMCGKRIPEFSGARLYGKRNTDMDQLKCLFIECDREEIENTLRNMDYANSRYNKYRRNQDIVLPD